MEVLVKMVLTVINVHVCLDLMERIVKTVSVFYLCSFSLSLIICFLNLSSKKDFLLNFNTVLLFFWLKSVE